jgi:hypothetical protein
VNSLPAREITEGKITTFYYDYWISHTKKTTQKEKYTSTFYVGGL